MRLAPLVAAAALAGSPAFAAVPEKGEGTITLLGGARILIPGNGAYLDEQGAAHRLFQPGGIASFGYQYDDELHVRIDIGYLYDRYRIAGGDLVVRTIPIMFGIDTALLKGPAFTLYGGGGVGYLLNTGSRSGVDNEANSTGGYLALGLRLRLTALLGAVIEERITISSAAVDAQSQQRLNVGGNLLSVGLMFHFLQPDDKGHPQAP